MAWLVVKPYTMHRDWNDVDKFEGRFASMTYVVGGELTPYDLTHRVEWAQPVANGALGAPLDPYQEYTMIKNMGSDPVLLYHNTFSNWPNPAFSRVILPGHWIEVVDLDVTTQPRIWVDSALYSSPMECEVIQIGYQYWEEQEPEEFCDMWAVGRDIDAGCTFKHYPEGAGVWATIASTITDADHWLADVAGVAEDDYWAVGFETAASFPSAGIVAYWNGTVWAEVAPESPPPFFGDWGFATADFWAVGGVPAGNWEIWNWNGISWANHTSGDQDTRTLYCVHGNQTNHVYAAGLLGIIVEWNGVAWATHATSPEMEGYHFFGTWTSNTPETWVCGGDAGAAPNVWLGPSGGNGCIFVEAPAGSGLWQSYTLPDNCPTLRAMWGFSDNNIWAVGDTGWILHFDGFNWTRIPEPAALQGAYDYRGVFGCYPYSVWAIGTDKSDNNVIIQWDGANWAVAHGPNVDEFDLYGLKGVEVVP